jgi:excisionase family DNA binding protein
VSITATPLLTRKQAARYLCVSESTLDRLAARHQLATVHIGRNVRFHKHDLDTYIAYNTRAAHPTPVTR